MEEQKKIKKVFSGVVISDKMEKTIVVRVEKIFRHETYKKLVMRTKKYKVHDEENKAKVGDMVTFMLCRPYSKDKRYRLLDINS